MHKINDGLTNQQRFYQRHKDDPDFRPRSRIRRIDFTAEQWLERRRGDFRRYQETHRAILRERARKRYWNDVEAARAKARKRTRVLRATCWSALERRKRALYAVQWRKLHPGYSKQYSRKQVEAFSDGYINLCLGFIKGGYPPEIISAKRSHIKLWRMLHVKNS